jgi:hypothetical protein
MTDVDEPGVVSAETPGARKPDDSDLGLATPVDEDTKPKHSVVGDMFGVPEDILERDLPPPSSSPRQNTGRTWALPREADAPAPNIGGITVPEPTVGKSYSSKAGRAAVPADRTGLPPDARDGAPPAAGDRHAAEESRRKTATAPARGVAGGAHGAAGSPAASRPPTAAEYRNLHPFGPSSMRPTGLQDPPALIDPYGGLSGSRGRAATVGSPYIPPNRLPSVTVPRVVAPAGPSIPSPPGNRYDGGRGYGY